MANIFGIGVTALQAAQLGLVTTQHNIANANTAGFHRQSILQSQMLPQQTGAGFVGSGVNVDSVSRIYNQFLEKQLLQANTQNSYLSTYYAQMRQLDSFLADPNAGLSPALQDFFKGVQDLAANPSSIPARQSVLSQAESLSSRFNTMQERFDEIRSGINKQLDAVVTNVNSYAAQIAALNDQIGNAMGFSGGLQPPNDLLDQREQLIAELNKIVQVSTVPGDNFSLDVYIGKGQPMVIGSRSYQLTTFQSPLDPDNKVVGYSTGGGGASTELPASLLSGGSLGALLEFRQSSLDTAQNSLGRVAAGLVETFNAQHALGVDLNGVVGNSFFSQYAGTTAPVVQPSTANLGAQTFDAVYSDVGALTTSNYQITVTALGPPDEYSVTDLQTGITTPGYDDTTIVDAIPGLTLTLGGGGAAVGDKFLVMPTRYAARDIDVALTDVTQIAAALPVVTGAGINNVGTATISQGDVVDTTTLPQGTITITYNGGNLDFTSDLGGVDAAFDGQSLPYTSGELISIGGVEFTISGSPVDGDTFTLTPNYVPAVASFTGDADNRNAMKLGTLISESTLVNNASGVPTASYQSAYSQMVSLVGNKTNEMKVRSTAQEALVEQTTREQQAFSGVNLDEEAANLLKYQYAYQAAAKSIETAQTVLDTLLSLGR